MAQRALTACSWGPASGHPPVWGLPAAAVWLLAPPAPWGGWDCKRVSLTGARLQPRSPEGREASWELRPVIFRGPEPSTRQGGTLAPLRPLHPALFPGARGLGLCPPTPAPQALPGAPGTPRIPPSDRDSAAAQRGLALPSPSAVHPRVQGPVPGATVRGDRLRGRWDQFPVCCGHAVGPAGRPEAAGPRDSLVDGSVPEPREACAQSQLGPGPLSSQLFHRAPPPPGCSPVAPLRKLRPWGPLSGLVPALVTKSWVGAAALWARSPLTASCHPTDPQPRPQRHLPDQLPGRVQGNRGPSGLPEASQVPGGHHLH